MKIKLSGSYLLKVLLWIGVISFTLSSCSYKKQNKMLLPSERPNVDNDVFIINKKVAEDSAYAHKIKTGDRIAVKFLNNYDLAKSTFNVESSTALEAGYVIDANGYANMPLIGKVLLAGMTKEMASDKLEKLYSSILNNPIIEVAIVSIKVNVFGEVGRQGKYLIDREKLSLVDLLAEAGGFTSKASKKHVRIIRGDAKNPEIIMVDMRKVGILQYSDLLIQDNDIVIVDPQYIYLITDPATAVGTALQPLLIVVNTVLVIVTLSNQ
jgi:polysaccharide biosynthesis/export protein